MLRNSSCEHLCTNKVPAEDGKFINDRIREGYNVNWLVDGLPAAEMKIDSKTGQTFYDMGFMLGTGDEDHLNPAPALNNHLDITIRYSYSPDVTGTFF
jgi:transmembrane 9 superfamily protein 2/4